MSSKNNSKNEKISSGNHFDGFYPTLPKLDMGGLRSVKEVTEEKRKNSHQNTDNLSLVSEEENLNFREQMNSVLEELEMKEKMKKLKLEQGMK